MHSAPEVNTDGPGRLRLFGEAGLTAVVAPLSETEAITEGLERTAGLIRSAAAIMILVFAGFALGDFLVIKMLGFTLAVAVLMRFDATLVRIVIGPARLSPAGDWNWWPWDLAGATATAAQERIR